MFATDLDSELAKAPPNGRAFMLTTEDQVRIRIATWVREKGTFGTIFILPGRADFIEKQGHAVAELFDLDFSVCVIDFRGLGLSDRLNSDQRAGHVEDFADYQKDMNAVVRAATDLQLPKPWFIFGNSMGGCIGLRSLIDGLPFSACAFTSPMWGIKLPLLVKSIAPAALGGLRKIGLGNKYAPGEKADNYILKTTFEDNYITGDPEMYEHLEMINLELDRHWIAGATITWVHEALLETRSLARMSSPNVPCITFSAGYDPLVDLQAIKHRMGVWKNGQYTHLPNARHDILREGPDIRCAVLRNVADFFRS